MTVRGRPTSRHLQAVQPQEVARPDPEPVPPVACLAILAGRAGPRQPGHPDAPEPRVPRASAVRQGPVLPVPVPRDLSGRGQGSAGRRPGDLRQRGPAGLPADVRRSRIGRLTLSLREPGPLTARAIAVAPRPQGGRISSSGPIRSTTRSAEPHRPGRGAAPPPFALGGVGPEPGTAGDQPGRRARPYRGPMRCTSSGIICRGASRP